jgi:hypothetical protein
MFRQSETSIIQVTLRALFSTLVAALSTSNSKPSTSIIESTGSPSEINSKMLFKVVVVILTSPSGGFPNGFGNRFGHGWVRTSIYIFTMKFLIAGNKSNSNSLGQTFKIDNFEVTPKGIMITGIGSTEPLNPGPQHVGDYTYAFRLLVPNIDVIRLEDKSDFSTIHALACENGQCIYSVN